MNLDSILETLSSALPLPILLLAGLVALGAAGTVWRPRRDPVRWFTPAQRTWARRRAGGQCEYTSWWRRCQTPAQETDHFVPHSRGGATTIANAVAACRRHNQAKGATVLPWWQAKLLERRRRSYFPPGEPVDVGQRYRWVVSR